MLRTMFLMMSLFVIGSNVSTDVEDGPVVHFSFDDIDGQTINNTVDNGIVGILEWEAHAVPGYRGNGGLLNPYVDEGKAGSDFIRAAADPRINVEHRFTLALWVKSFNLGEYRSITANTDNCG